MSSMNMRLLPEPKKIQATQGVFDYSDSAVVLAGEHDPRVVRAADGLRRLLERDTGHPCRLIHSTVEAVPQKAFVIRCADKGAGEGYTLTVTPQGVLLAGDTPAGCFYGIQTMKQMLSGAQGQLPAVAVQDEPDMAYRGFYHDMSRGRVPTLDSMKRLVERMASYKLNAFQLYVEHTFAFAEFGRCSPDSCWTAGDMLELDAFCQEHFITLEPSLSTFGHLYELLSLPQYRHLCELENYRDNTHFWRERMLHHTIDPSNPESFDMVCSLIDQYLPLFRAKRFNICCDETFDLGRGRNRGKDVSSLYLGFVNKLIGHVREHGKTAMMWGDIVLQHPEALMGLPSDIVMLNWDYGPAPGRERIGKMCESGLPQIVCPGTSSWHRLVEELDISISNISRLAEYGAQYGAVGILNTNWGDYGHPCPINGALYGLLLGACKGWRTATAVDDGYDAAASELLYGDPSGGAVARIRALGKAEQAAPWLELFEWNRTRDSSVFTADAPALEAAEQVCGEAAEYFGSLPLAGGVTRDLVLAAQGIALSCKAVGVLRRGSGQTAWAREADGWFERYAAAWRADNKESELSEIGAFLHRFMEG